MARSGLVTNPKKKGITSWLFADHVTLDQHVQPAGVTLIQKHVVHVADSITSDQVVWEGILICSYKVYTYNKTLMASLNVSMLALCLWTFNFVGI